MDKRSGQPAPPPRDGLIGDVLQTTSVLYVEDDEDIRVLLARYLQRRVGKLYLAENGRAGLDAWREHRPDIVITDIMMPVMDGLEMAKAIRLEDTEVPIIVTTAYNEANFFIRAIDVGIDKYVVKPIDPQLLLDAMRRCAREVKAAQERLLAAAVFENSSSAVFITNADNRIVAVNPAFSTITGYEAGEIIGQTPAILSSGRQSPAFYQDMWRDLLEAGNWSGEIWNRRKCGEFYAELLTINAVSNSAGKLTHFVAIFSDITRHKLVEEKVHHLAHYDALTDLPNRTLFGDRLGQALKQAPRHEAGVAVMFIDLDRFKEVNDTLGHGIGDVLLQDTARRLLHCVREGDTVSRLGGDEFVALLSEIRHTKDIERIAGALLDAVARPYCIEGHDLRISASIGISCYPQDGDTAEALMKNADIALYRAKDQGRNNFQFYDPEMSADAFERFSLEAGIHQALEKDEFELYYQPRFDRSGQCIVGVEALLRWHHPELGLVPPMEFIPLAEKSVLILRIGEWVLRTALAQGMAWQQAGLPVLCISVNVSPRQFRQADFVEQIQVLLAESGFDARHLELELTETALMAHSEENIQTLRQLRSLGVRVAIDDFGTGYSSLSYLRRLPVDVLKIDRSFISELTGGQHDNPAIIEAILAMGHSLGLQVVAEGIETAGQLTHLEAMHCDELQGFHLGHPLRAEALAQLMTPPSISQKTPEILS